jgi:hypothetical protein
LKIEYPFPLADLVITLRRGACYGTCPIYSLEVHGTGEVIYHGKEFVNVVGTRESKIAESVVLSLLDYAIRIGFFNMNDEYNTEIVGPIVKNGLVYLEEYGITDLPDYEVTISIGNVKKKVRDYAGAPKELRKFEDLIDKVCNVKRWIK